MAQPITEKELHRIERTLRDVVGAAATIIGNGWQSERSQDLAKASEFLSAIRHAGMNMTIPENNNAACAGQANDLLCTLFGLTPDQLPQPPVSDTELRLRAALAPFLLKVTGDPDLDREVHSASVTEAHAALAASQLAFPSASAPEPAPVVQAAARRPRP